MLARVYSCAVIGLDGVVIEVEVDYIAGFPGMTKLGRPSPDYEHLSKIGERRSDLPIQDASRVDV